MNELRSRGKKRQKKMSASVVVGCVQGSVVKRWAVGCEQGNLQKKKGEGGRRRRGEKVDK